LEVAAGELVVVVASAVDTEPAAAAVVAVAAAGSPSAVVVVDVVVVVVAAVVAVVELFAPSALAGFVLFSSQYYGPTAVIVVSTSLRRCTLQKTLRIGTAIPLTVLPFVVISSTNRVAHLVCVASTNEHYNYLQQRLDVRKNETLDKKKIAIRLRPNKNTYIFAIIFLLSL
jgi:hypothetical protein